jgi:RNA polymerase sigma-70 factor (ECF subfamily)
MNKKQDIKKMREFSADGWIIRAMEDYEDILLKYTWRLTGSYQKAQDVVQDAFLKLCRADREKVGLHLKAWLFKVCRNRAFEIQRRERKMESLSELQLNITDSGEPTPYDRLEKSEDALRLNKMIEKLPEKHREIVYLKFQSNLSYKEISEVANISVSNVGFILHKAIRQLRNDFC